MFTDSQRQIRWPVRLSVRLMSTNWLFFVRVFLLDHGQQTNEETAKEKKKKTEFGWKKHDRRGRSMVDGVWS